MSNHLGNVLATVSDKRLPVAKSNDTVVSRYNAVVVSASDYYPFGMVMVGRGFSSEKYRFGFNGKENDREITNGGVDFGARVLDKRIGRWFSVDPDKKGWFSPYQSFGNNPILFKDPDGRWQTDGHYWTIYLLASILQIPNAEKIAYYAEFPDTDIHKNIAYEKYTWANGNDQTRTHSLTGLEYVYERNYTIDNLLNTSISDLKEYGRLLHRLGDNYAHRDLHNPDYMYGNMNGYTTEHLTKDGSAPDLIYNRVNTGDYMNYAKDALFTMSLSFNTKINYLDALEKTIPILTELMSYAKMNTVSLIGIINYEVAKIQGAKEFYIHNPISVLSTDYNKHLTDTRNYLDSKKVMYKEEKKYMTQTMEMPDGSGSYSFEIEIGTKFTIK